KAKVDARVCSFRNATQTSDRINVAATGLPSTPTASMSHHVVASAMTTEQSDRLTFSRVPDFVTRLRRRLECFDPLPSPPRHSREKLPPRRLLPRCRCG